MAEVLVVEVGSSLPIDSVSGSQVATDADSAPATVAIANRDSLDKVSAVMPDERGKQVHLIFELTDNGTPPLAGCRRVIYNIQ